jgi:hypothetical protein
MISYRLRCYNDHEFDAWFRDSQSYGEQQAQNLVACPNCGICEVNKAITAPHIIKSKSSRQDLPKPTHTSHNNKEALHRLNSYITQNFENVGENFATEARKIAEGDAESRSIYGKAKPEEVQDLNDEGIEVFVVPTIPPSDA